MPVPVLQGLARPFLFSTHLIFEQPAEPGGPAFAAFGRGAGRRPARQAGESPPANAAGICLGPLFDS